MTDNYQGEFKKYFNARGGHHFYFTEDQTKLFFLRDVDQKSLLFELNLEMSFELTNAKLIGPWDFSQTTFSIVDHLKDRNSLVISMDEKNTEMTNYFELFLDIKEIEAITNVKMARALNWCHDKKNFFYFNREPVKNGMHQSTLYFCQLENRKSSVLLSDEKWQYKIGWGSIVLSSDGKKIYLPLDEFCRRQKTNVAAFNVQELFQKNSFSDHEPVKLLPPSIEAGTPYIVAETISESGESVVNFISSHTEYLNVYQFVNKNLVPLTNEKWINLTYSDFTINSKSFFLLTNSDREQDLTRVVLIDLSAAKVLEKKIAGNISVMAGSEGLQLQSGSIDQPPELLLVSDSLEIQGKINIYSQKEFAIVHGSYSRVSYQSFDGLIIQAYLIMPRKPVVAAMVQAFYGGENNYSYALQMYLERGIAILSPAVRGSWGWGKEWEDLLQGDLGGDEIIDVIYGARFLEKKLGISQSKIGVFGGSHGGYAALRAITFPPTYKSRDVSFDFGFAICECGLADLVDFYKTSRIADWLVDLLGKYEENSELYFERSPLNYFEYLKTPLFIRHGTNDSRVPLSTMQTFIEKLESSKIFHDVLLQKDQGHHSQNIAILIEEKTRLFKFLKDIKII